MIKGLTIGEYLPGSSFLYLLDPRTKLLLLLVFITLLFCRVSFSAYLLAVVFIIICLLNSRAPINKFIRGLKPFLIIAIITVLLHLFLTPGSTLFDIRSLTATEEGLVGGAVIAFRLLLLVSASTIVTLTTSPIQLGRAVERLLSPLSYIGLPVTQLSIMFSIALRFLPTLMIETDKIIKAQVSRGAKIYEGNLAERVKALIPITVPLLAGSFRKAEALAVAMEARGYTRKGVTRVDRLRFGSRDLLAVAITSFFALIYFAF